MITGVTPSMLMRGEETFGPVAGVTHFTDEEEALRLANDTPYGLAAYVYPRDSARVWRLSEGLETGLVGINTVLVSNAVVPFGGVKESGLGREGSRHGIEEWLELKHVAVAGLTG